MSVEINWETLTGGPDGKALAETIRAFIDERFQQVHFPKLIRSVHVHSFDFGTAQPQVVLKDIGDPLQDFYEYDDGNEDLGERPARQQQVPQQRPAGRHSARSRDTASRLPDFEPPGRTHSPGLGRGGAGSTMFGGGISNLGYFHMPLSAGLSGTSTPLAAVAGAHWHNGLRAVLDEGHQRQQHPRQRQYRHSSESFDPSSPSSPVMTPASSRPGSRDKDDRTNTFLEQRSGKGTIAEDNPDGSAEAGMAAAAAAAAASGHTSPPRTDTEVQMRERHPEDVQVVFHLTYSGDVRLSMTAEVFLDYPMPQFVGIPLKLNITGAKFDGVGILAYIKRRAHLCFLSPEDAEALVGAETVSADEGGVAAGADDDNDTPPRAEDRFRVGGLLEEIKIESEMGETGDGRQVLKNVGKIEKFILEQVQRIFEDEFVYPSFWTFLV